MVDGECGPRRSGACGIPQNETIKPEENCAPASLTAFLGIVEPIVFGVNLKLIRPFIGAAIGGAIGGAYVVAVQVVANSYGLTGIPMISIVLPFGAANFVHYMIGFLIAAVSAFIATLFLGFKEETE